MSTNHIIIMKMLLIEEVTQLFYNYKYKYNYFTFLKNYWTNSTTQAVLVK